MGPISQDCATQKAQKDKLTITDLPRAAKSTLFCCSLKEILERHLSIYRSWVVATFSAIAKALPGRMLCRPAISLFVKYTKFIRKRRHIFPASVPQYRCTKVRISMFVYFLMMPVILENKLFELI